MQQRVPTYLRKRFDQLCWNRAVRDGEPVLRGRHVIGQGNIGQPCAIIGPICDRPHDHNRIAFTDAHQTAHQFVGFGLMPDFGAQIML